MNLEIKRILMIHSGGTIGMVEKDNVFTTQKEKIFDLIGKNDMLNDEEFLKQNFKEINNNENEFGQVKRTFITPKQKNNERIIYDLIETDEIIDSSAAKIDDWYKILQIIKNNYNKYLGFVVLHGTDTMAYATCFFHYMIENPAKNIIFTGSMIPMSVNKVEGQMNILRSLQSIYSHIHPGVYLQFGKLFFSGHKIYKFSSKKATPFRSKDQLKVKVSKLKPALSNNIKATIFKKSYEKRVAILKIYPGINKDVVNAVFLANRGVVLETYGNGNGLSEDLEIINCIKEFVQNGGMIYNVSQCTDGVVTRSYEASSDLYSAGAIPGGSLTAEAAFCKLVVDLGSER